MGQMRIAVKTRCVTAFWITAGELRYVAKWIDLEMDVLFSKWNRNGKPMRKWAAQCHGSTEAG